MEIGGGCEPWSCRNDDQQASCALCTGCFGEGPGADGCFRPPELSGECNSYLSDSAFVFDNKDHIFTMAYLIAKILWDEQDSLNYVRCVRGELLR